MRWIYAFTLVALFVVSVHALATGVDHQSRKSSSISDGATETCWRGNLKSIPSPTMIVWLIDGNNLSCSRGVPNDRETIVKELAKIASSRCETDSSDCATALPTISHVMVVFDGNENEPSNTTNVDTNVWLEWTVVDGRTRRKDRADDWIINKTIPNIRNLISQRFDEKEGTTRVNVVSADRDLQKRVAASRILNGGSLVHPPRFWKEYLPVLQEKQQQQQE